MLVILILQRIVFLVRQLPAIRVQDYKCWNATPGEWRAILPHERRIPSGPLSFAGIDVHQNIVLLENASDPRVPGQQPMHRLRVGTPVRAEAKQHLASR